MDASEILDHYQNIEYLSTEGDNGWYKLKDYYPWAFRLEEDPDIVVLDAGGEQGSPGGHFKIQDGKLLCLDCQSHEWRTVTDVRVLPGPSKPQRNRGIVAVGDPFIIEREGD